MRSPPLRFLPAVAAALLGGCTPPLAETYDGSIFCDFDDDNSADFSGELSWSLEQPSPDRATGRGSLSWEDLDGLYWEVNHSLTMELIADRGDGRSDWSTQLSSCVEIDVGALECPHFVSTRVVHPIRSSSNVHAEGWWFGGSCEAFLF